MNFRDKADLVAASDPRDWSGRSGQLGGITSSLGDGCLVLRKLWAAWKVHFPEGGQIRMGQGRMKSSDPKLEPPSKLGREPAARSERAL